MTLNKSKLRVQSRYLFPLIALLIVILVPKFNLSIDITTYLTVVSLLFTILVGFFIAASTTNYLRLQYLISQEDGGLMQIFNLTRLIQPTKQEEVADAIDQYTIAALNFEISLYTERSQKEFDQLVETLNQISATTGKGGSLMQLLHIEVSQLFKIRQEVSLAAQRIVGNAHWLILILLALLIDILLLALENGSLLSIVVTTVLVTSTYLVLLLVYEVDSNHFWEEKLSYENSQRIFDFIKKRPYFPEEAFKNKRILRPQKSFRMGIISSDKNNRERKIELVEKLN